MTWKTLSTQGRIESHRSSHDEIQGLRAIVDRNLRDAALPALSPDNRSGLPCEAALLLAKMVVTCDGYRARASAFHAPTFEPLRLAMGPGMARRAGYLHCCHRMQNQVSDDVTGVDSEAEAGEMLEQATEFQATVEDWIRNRHPRLAP